MNQQWIITTNSGTDQPQSAPDQALHKYQELMNSVKAIIWEMDPFSFHFSFVSSGVSQILGFSVLRWLNEPDFWENHLYPEDRMAVFELLNTEFNRVRAGDLNNSPPFELEYRMIAADGRVVWLKNIVKVVTDADHELKLQGLMVDITSHMQTESPLKEKERIEQSLFDSSPVGQFITDLETGCIVQANTAACTLFGYTCKEFIGCYTATLFPSSYVYLATECLQTVSAAEKFQQESINRRKDGTTFYSEIFGTTIIYHNLPHVLWTIHDTSRQQLVYQEMQHKLGVDRAQLKSLLEAAPLILASSDSQTLIRVVFDQLKRLVDYQGIILLSVQGDEGQLKVLGQRSPITDEQDSAKYLASLSGSVLIQQILMQQHLRIIGDLQGETTLAQAMQSSFGTRLCAIYPFMRAFMAVPLIVKGRTTGVVCLIHKEPDYYTLEHAKVAQSICNKAALALENIQLIQLVKSARELTTLKERRRLASELHDSTVQVFCSILLMADAAHKIQDQGTPEQISSILSRISSVAEGGLEEMRALILDLHPEELAQGSLVVALNNLSTAMRARYDLEIDARLGEPEPDIAPELKVALYRIAREALHNVVKHAHATQVNLSLDWPPADSEGVIILQIRDNGRGFNPDNACLGHLGLQTMRERATQLRGNLDIESSPGEGSCLVAYIPLRKVESGS